MTECSEIIGIMKVNDITSSVFLFYENETEGKLLEGQPSQRFTLSSEAVWCEEK